jgi:hypothetical protein
MSEIGSLITTVSVSLAVSTAVLLVMIRPLRRVLGMMCRSGEATPFWISFTIVMLYAVPLFIAMVWMPMFEDSVRTVRVALVGSLFGIIGGLVVIGMKISRARLV